ncbi:MAG: hypothetical protein ABJA74_05975 [Lapillicoccus sp.]
MAGRVWGDGGGGLTYAVVTDELVAASEAIAAVTQSASSATVESLPALVSDVGHPGVFAGLRDFCARWDNGLSHLVGDSTAMADKLGACADAYVVNEDERQGAYQQLFSCALVGGDPAALPPVEPIG